MKIDDGWFTEFAPEAGMALSLKLENRLYAEQSDYQKIEIYETTDFGTLMVIDGCVMLTDRDNFIYHEMMAHPVLFAHPAPRRVLIVGGGDCGTLREVLKHPEIEHVIQAEIDERVTRLAEQYFPELCETNGDVRAELYFGDGIQWVKDAPAESLDVIIVDSTDPVGPAAGLFTAAFYGECLRALAPGGLVIQQSESPLLHLPILRGMYGAFYEAGFADVRTLVFPQATYPSGWWSATMARREATLRGFRRDAALAAPFTTRYYSADVHAAALALPPFLLEALGKIAG